VKAEVMTIMRGTRLVRHTARLSLSLTQRRGCPLSNPLPSSAHSLFVTSRRLGAGVRATVVERQEPGTFMTNEDLEYVRGVLCSVCVCRGGGVACVSLTLCARVVARPIISIAVACGIRERTSVSRALCRSSHSRI
jgi:hypothetical protein